MTNSSLQGQINMEYKILCQMSDLHVPSLYKRLCHFFRVRVICFVIFQRCKLSFLVRIKSKQLSFSRTRQKQQHNVIFAELIQYQSDFCQLKQSSYQPFSRTRNGIHYRILTSHKMDLPRRSCA